MNKILLLLLLASFELFAQNSLHTEHIKDLQKNILTHRIKFYGDNNYKELLPDKGWELKLDVLKIKDTFEISNKKWTFFTVENDNFTYKETTGKNIRTKYFSHGIPEYYKLSKLGLVVLNEKNELIFIGGNFFKTPIAKEFDLSVVDFKTFFKYIRIKLFNFRIDKIKYIKKKKGYLIFRGFSNTIYSEIKIKIDINDFDNIIIEDCSK